MSKDIRYRYENFGGIISSQNPPFLAFVDREYMRELGVAESDLWQDENEDIGLLSAPVEVHFAITNRCNVGCAHCYMDAGASDEGELGTQAFKDALTRLADMGVFHTALGGGDALLRDDLFEIADHAHSVGLVPNLTISGLDLTADIARKLRRFGQVNLSVDGIHEHYAVFRGVNHFATVDKAFDMLVEAGVPTGINCVVGRRNFDLLPQLFEYAAQKGLNEIEFLRLKPSGRGKSTYDEEKTTHEQNMRLASLLAELSNQYGITAKIDCSFVPMLCAHNPPMDMLQAMATYGCEAGNVLYGVRSNGEVSGCSFLESPGVTIDQLGAGRSAQLFSEHVSWTDNPPAPCDTCDYLAICKGGCRAVTLHATGTIHGPDPDCPMVRNHKAGKDHE